MISCPRTCVIEKITGPMHHVTRYAVDKTCSRSCVQNACGHNRRMEIRKQSSRQVPRCRLDASELLPKSAVSSARFLPRREVKFMRTRIWNTTNDQRTQETFKLVLPSRRKWHPCQSIGQLAQFTQPIRKPTAQLHVRADLLAMTESPNNKHRKKHTKKLQSICMRFKVHASSRQLLMQTPIRLSYFPMPSSRTTFEKTVEKSNSFRSTA